jgi:histidinol-phosphate/aromatic aminotransferase/cobyric acid decarboxylase-like protein
MSPNFRPGVHGGDGARLAESLGVAVEEVLDLSASLNPVAPNFEMLLRGYLGALGRYPQADRATTALASCLGVDPDLVVLTNGGAEAIALLAAENPVGWVRDPEFSLYRRHLREVIPGAPRWRSNPHNPSGLLAAPEETSEVWDEAFWALAAGTWTRGDVARGGIVVGSLTKLLACPGLRIGYVICPDHDLAERIRLRQPAWSLNGLVAAALPEMLSEVRLVEWASAIAELREELRGLLVSAGFTPEPSDANWLLVRAPGLRDRLGEAAISVRDCTNFAMPGYVRIAVPGWEGLGRLAQALGRAAE